MTSWDANLSARVGRSQPLGAMRIATNPAVWLVKKALSLFLAGNQAARVWRLFVHSLGNRNGFVAE